MRLLLCHRRFAVHGANDHPLKMQDEVLAAGQEPAVVGQAA
jgi:hypothetical protein